ncbi:hypothetical protein BpHYR1_012446 [Brachionus plicatilis]|uniref:Uncharacterized protein n=1 Tax=Brachionus plicatilis TaxID=10195 RepID=A0A3M7P3Y6_BRAPC|nr:hypothetical protein BpHYR1_012446 [Brachionus plicatilis]
MPTVLKFVLDDECPLSSLSLFNRVVLPMACTPTNINFTRFMSEVLVFCLIKASNCTSLMLGHDLRSKFQSLVSQPSLGEIFLSSKLDDAFRCDKFSK